MVDVRQVRLVLVQVRDVTGVLQEEELAATGAIPGAVNIPLGQLQGALSLSPEQWTALHRAPAPALHSPIVFSCLAGIRSAKAQVHLSIMHPRLAMQCSSCPCTLHLDGGGTQHHTPCTLHPAPGEYFI